MKVRLILWLLFVAALSSHAQRKELIDSLENFLHSAVSDSVKVKRINDAYFGELWKYNSAEPYKLLKEALDISKKSGYLRGELNTYKNMVGYCRNRGQFQFAKKYTAEFKKIALQLKDTQSYASALITEGMNLRDERKPDSSLTRMMEGMDYYLRFHANKDQLARLYYQLAATYTQLHDRANALHYAQLSLQLREELNYGDGIDASLFYLASLYAEDKNFPMILETAQKALLNREAVKDSVRIASYMGMIGYAQAMLGRQDSAFRNLDFALGVLKRRGAMPNGNGSIYQWYSEACEKAGDTKKALEYYKLAIAYRDSSQNLEQANSISKTAVLFDVEEKENQIKMLDQEKKVQSYSLIAGAVILLAVLVISFFVFRAYTLKNEANILLAEQKKIIEDKNKEVMDSITYAKRLQSAILLPENELRKSFAGLFVLFKPRNIVSGDFYWFSESLQNKIIAVADCTGHGVPGGFMSMLGYESLQDVALKENIVTTGEALYSLDKKITDALNKSDRSFRDGMDIVLCAFSKKENKLQYSGANRPLIHISEGKLKEYKASKLNIGGAIDSVEKNFATIQIEYKEGDRFYLFTDGYADQFGGLKGKKFKSKNLIDLLMQTSSLSMPEQKKVIENTYNDWKDKLEQVDDVCMIGIEV